MMAIFRWGFTSCCDAVEQRSASTGSVILKIDAVWSTEMWGKNIPITSYRISLSHATKYPYHTLQNIPTTRYRISLSHATKYPYHTLQNIPTTRYKIPLPHATKYPYHTLQNIPTTRYKISLSHAIKGSQNNHLLSDNRLQDHKNEGPQGCVPCTLV
jgi:hypothetical protein